jgi:hypothetical protein
MTGLVEPSLFDFVDGFAARVREGQVHAVDSVSDGDDLVVFGESFFDQFFSSAVGKRITGFDPTSQSEVGLWLEESKLNPAKHGWTGEVRDVIVMFEKFCDVYFDAIYGTDGSITLSEFYKEYVDLLLVRAAAWAQSVASESDAHQALADRAVRAQQECEAAVEAAGW